MTNKEIIEAFAWFILFLRGIFSHMEHKGTSRDVKGIRSTMNGEFEKRLAEEKIKWEKENARQ